MVTIAEAIRELVARQPNIVPCVVIPAGDALIVDVNTVAVWTDRVTVPLVMDLNAALAVVFVGVPVKSRDGVGGGVQVAPLEDDDD